MAEAERDDGGECSGQRRQRRKERERERESGPRSGSVIPPAAPTALELTAKKIFTYSLVIHTKNSLGFSSTYENDATIVCNLNFECTYYFCNLKFEVSYL